MSSQILRTPLPYIALLLAHIIWGANFVVAKVTLQEFPPMSLAFLRFALASFFLAPFFFIQTKKVKIDTKDLPKLIAIGIFMTSLNIAFFLEGIQRTTAINASVLTLVIPIFSVLCGWWFLKEKVLFINLLGIGIGLVGTLVIIGLPQILSGNYSPQTLTGNTLITLASLSWVIGATVSKSISGKYSSLVITAVSFMVSTIVLLIPAALEYINNPGWPTQVTFLGLLGLAYMTLLSSISAYFLFEWGLFQTSIIAADLFQYIEPFIATSLAIAVLGERISTSFIIGAIFIVVGLYIGTLAKQIHHRHKAHRV